MRSISMRLTLRTLAIGLVIVLVLLPNLVFAQAPAVDTPTAEPPTPTFTPTHTPTLGTPVAIGTQFYLPGVQR